MVSDGSATQDQLLLWVSRLSHVLLGRSVEFILVRELVISLIMTHSSSL